MKQHPFVLAVIPLIAIACSHPAREMDLSGQPAPQATPAGVSFAGTWVYNPDDSDHPGRYGMQGGGGGRYGGRGGFGGGGRGGFGGGRGFGGRGGGDAQGEDRDAADSLVRFRSPPPPTFAEQNVGARQRRLRRERAAVLAKPERSIGNDEFAGGPWLSV